jgi:hypothetical protein
MSRAPPAAHPRALTLTEELEKLEQSITLTLQGEPTPQQPPAELILPEIDHNFSRAHRIVTSSILPIIEQYSAHSKDVWEGSRVRHSPMRKNKRAECQHSSGNNSLNRAPTYLCLATKNNPHMSKTPMPPTQQFQKIPTRQRIPLSKPRNHTRPQRLSTSPPIQSKILTYPT